MEIDIMSLIKKLRSETLAPLGDCQKALKHTSGDYDEAKLYLRKLGLASAENRSLRTTDSGCVAAFASGNFGVILEVNSETDFVARSNIFQALVTSIVLTAYHNKVDNIIDLMKFKVDLRVIKSYVPLISKMFDVDFIINDDDISQISGESIDHAIKIIISIVGENISLSKLGTLATKDGFVLSYLHNRQSPIVGSAGILLSVQTELSGDEVRQFVHKLAIHTIASKPYVVDEHQLSPDLLEKEKEVYKHQIAEDGKSGDIADKILAGKLAKYYEKVVLLKQPYFFDPALSVGDLLDSKKADFGAKNLNVSEFKMFFLGS